VCGVVEVVLGVRVRHAGRITPDDVEVDAGRQSRLAVPLDLSAHTRVIGDVIGHVT